MTLKLFSHRKQLKPSEKLAQLDGIDDDLRTGLWNVFLENFLRTFKGYHAPRIESSNLEVPLRWIWDEYFKRPIDTIPTYMEDAAKFLREYFFRCPWFEVYDFLEFAALTLPTDAAGIFREQANYVLARENSAYRFVGVQVTQITSEAEVQAVEDALSETSGLKAVNHHLTQALRLLSDRKAPDFPNSIKESISAVEGVVQMITGEKGATLNKALDRLARSIPIHGALRQALSSLYGYTSDAEGIRHALHAESTLTFADAKFMLVSCSTFVSYLLAKSEESGLRLS